VRTYFERDEFAVVWLRSGEEALIELASQKIDLVVLDIGLPGIDGFEVCRPHPGSLAGAHSDVDRRATKSPTESPDSSSGRTTTCSSRSLLASWSPAQTQFCGEAGRPPTRSAPSRKGRAPPQ